MPGLKWVNENKMVHSTEELSNGLRYSETIYSDSHFEYEMNETYTKTSMYKETSQNMAYNFLINAMQTHQKQHAKMRRKKGQNICINEFLFVSILFHDSGFNLISQVDIDKNGLFGYFASIKLHNKINPLLLIECSISTWDQYVPSSCIIKSFDEGRIMLP